MNNVEPVYEPVDRLVVGSVSLPDNRYWYVNYCQETEAHRARITDSFHLGPYPVRLARYIAEVWVPRVNHYTEGVGSLRHLKPTLSIKPRKGSIRGVGPTKGELEALILLQVSEHLDTWRRLQEWYSNNNR